MKFHWPHYIPQPYRIASVGGRLLQIPNAGDRRLQREIYEQVKPLCPVSWQPEQIQTRIREALRANPKKVALRTDLRNCFGTIPQNLVCSRITALPLPEHLRRALLNVIRPVPRGLPTGSPLSPWLAELVLRDLDAAMGRFRHYFRYVDDICVLGNPEDCAAARKSLEEALRPLGMSLNPEKTCILPAEELVFLGRSYQLLDDAQLLEVDLSGDTFRLPNHKQVRLRVNRTGQPYSDAGGRITYSVSCLLNRLSQQPTPYVLEMLMLRPACEDPTLSRIIQNPELIVDQGLPHALHGKIYRHYLTHVKARLEGKATLPIGAAGEVFRWLHLTNHIMQTGRLPDDYQPAEAEWPELLVSLEAGQYAPYHQRIKELFRQEYELRNGPRTGAAELPAAKPALAAFALD